MAVLSSPEDEIGSFQEQKKEKSQVVESFIDQEDDDSFVNSLLDHDFLRDWMDSESGSEVPVSFKEVELNSAEQRVAEECCLKMDITDGDVTCGKVMVEEGAAGDESGNLGNIRFLIEEEMGKVNLDGVYNVSATESVDLDVAKEIAAKEGGVDNSDEQSIEIVVSGKEGGDQPVSIDGNSAKDRDQESSDGDESDSDSESDYESETESESSSSSSSSSSDDDDEEEGHDAMLGRESKELGGQEEREIEEGELEISDNEDDIDGFGIGSGAIRSKNEITDLPPVPPVNVTLQPHQKTLPVGAVLAIVGTQVVIEGTEKHNPLNEGSILWITESRNPLGFVDEIFGQVKSPHYIVRYNSRSEVPTGVQPGTLVSFVPEYATYVLNDKSIYQKGYDASGPNDEEVFDEEEFSDDEKEAEHKRLMQMKKRAANDEKVGNKNIDKKTSRNRRKWKRHQSAAPNAQVPSGPGNYESSFSQGCVIGHQSGTTPSYAQTRPNPNFNTPAGGSNVIPFQFGAGQGSHQSQSTSGQGHGGLMMAHPPGMVPPFAQTGPNNPSFSNMPAAAGVSNAIPFQLPWMQFAHPQPIYQMPPPIGLPYQYMQQQQQQLSRSGMPFQQQTNPIPPGGGGQSAGFRPGFVPQQLTFFNQGMQNQPLPRPSPSRMGTPRGQHTPGR